MSWHASPIDTLANGQRATETHGAKAKLLSQGLNFLYTYLRETDVSARIINRIERLSGFPDKFLINALRKIWLKSLIHRQMEIPVARIADNPNRPNAGWVHFFPFETFERFDRGYACEPSVRFDASRQHSLRYLNRSQSNSAREYGMDTWLCSLVHDPIEPKKRFLRPGVVKVRLSSASHAFWGGSQRCIVPITSSAITLTRFPGGAMYLQIGSRSGWKTPNPDRRTRDGLSLFTWHWISRCVRIYGFHSV